MIVDKFSTSIIYDSLNYHGTRIFKYFNLIGTVYSCIKVKQKNSLLKAKEPKENYQEWIKVNLLRICKSFTGQAQLNIFKSYKRLINKYLKHYLPYSAEIQYLEGLEAKCRLTKMPRKVLYAGILLKKHIFGITKS